MNVSLTPELEKLIRRKVATGRYASTSEVVREALRLLEQRDQGAANQLSELRTAWEEGIAGGPAGELDFGDLRRKAKARLKRKRPRP